MVNKKFKISKEEEEFVDWAIKLQHSSRQNRLNELKKKLYQCKECKLYYKDKDLAKECYKYCKKYKACNINIIKDAVK